ncbi:MAG: ABC transporter ATP-binding protein [candidate division NC10 bacterium]
MEQNELVTLTGLSKWFEVGGGFLRKPAYVQAVEGVSLAIHRGETVALVGESGSGKTTLGRTILRLLEPTAGELQFDGEIVTHAPQKEIHWLHKRAQMIPQDPYSSLNPTFPIYKVLEEPLVIHKSGDKKARSEMVMSALENVHLTPPESFAGKYPHMLSGGQRQRVAIARAMILNPEFIVADEPVSALDASVKVSVLTLLQDIQRDLDVSFLHITHDLATTRHFSERIGIMYAGKLVELGPKDSVIREPMHPYTQALIEAIPDLDPDNRFRDRPSLPGEPPALIAPPKGCRFHPRCPIAKGGLCDEEEPLLRELRPGHVVACHLAE